MIDPSGALEILDLRRHTEEGGEETLRTRLLERVNQENVRFAYSYDVDRQGRGNARVILAGSSAAVQRIMADV